MRCEELLPQDTECQKLIVRYVVGEFGTQRHLKCVHTYCSVNRESHVSLCSVIAYATSGRQIILWKLSVEYADETWVQELLAQVRRHCHALGTVAHEQTDIPLAHNATCNECTVYVHMW